MQQIRLKTKAKQIDVLVNNSGILLDYQEKIDLPKIKATFDVNLFGVIDFTQRMLPLVKAGGHIVNISSRYGSFSEMDIEESDAIGSHVDDTLEGAGKAADGLVRQTVDEVHVYRAEAGPTRGIQHRKGFGL